MPTPRTSALTLLLLAALACDGQAPGPVAPRPSEGDRRHVSEHAGVLRPSERPASRYGVEQPYAIHEVEQTILDPLLAAAPGALSHDRGLSVLARDLARSSPSRYDMPPSLIDGLMAWYGVIDPQPAVIVIELEGTDHGCHLEQRAGCDEVYAALREEVARTLAQGDPGAVWRLGVGAAATEDGASTRLLVALVERRIELAPIPVAVPDTSGVRVDGRLLGRRSQPRIERVGPRGHWAAVPAVVGDDGSVQAEVPCDAGRGVYQIEVLANGDTGPEVVANFRVFCGVDRPSQIAFTYERVGPGVTVADVVRRNFELLNEAREARGLPTLTWDDAAARVAMAHSADMRANGFVGHVSPKTGDASARFDRAGIVGTVVRENVARGYGPMGVHESLMNSPGHRANMLAGDISHVGIGVVFGPPEGTAADAPRPVFLTQNFYAKPGALAPDRPVAALRQQVDDTRKAAGVPRAQWHRGLGKLAQTRADGAAGVGPGLADEDLQEKLRAFGFASLDQHQVSGDFEAFATLDLWAQLDAADHLGIGVARADGGRYVLVILVGHP